MTKISIILFSVLSMLSSIMNIDDNIYDSWKIKSKSEVELINDSVKNLSNYYVNNIQNLQYIISDSFPLDSKRKYIFNEIFRLKKLPSLEIYEEYGSGEVPFYILHVMETGNNDTIKYYYDAYRKLKPLVYKDFIIENIVFYNFKKFDVVDYLLRNKKFINKNKVNLNNYISYTHIIQDKVVQYKIISNYEFEASDSINWNRIH